MNQNQSMIGMAVQFAGTITLHIQRETASLQKRIDQLERRIAKLEQHKATAREDG